MSATAEAKSYSRNRYHQRIADGLCGRCGCEKLPEWRTVNCPTCNQALSAPRTTAASRRRLRVKKARYANRRYHRLRAAKLCFVCEEPTGGPVRCSTCAPEHVAQTLKRRAARKLASTITPIRPPLSPPDLRDVTTTPIADYHRGDISLSRAAIRFAELCNGVDAQTIGDEFGADLKQRNGIGIALMRGVREGRLIVNGAGPGREFYPVRRARRAA